MVTACSFGPILNSSRFYVRGRRPFAHEIKPGRLAVCSGYNEVGANVIDLDAKHATQFIALKQTFNGLAFSRDGRSLWRSNRYPNFLRALQPRSAYQKHNEIPRRLTQKLLNSRLAQTRHPLALNGNNLHAAL